MPDTPQTVDVIQRAAYWYPDDGGQVWTEGFQLVAPDGRFLGRNDPSLASRGLHVTHVAGAGRHHREALETADLVPGEAVDLRRDLANAHDPNAIGVYDATGAQIGWVPRELAALAAPELDAGRAWHATVLREQRHSPRDPRTGVTLLLGAGPVHLRVRTP